MDVGTVDATLFLPAEIVAEVTPPVAALAFVNTSRPIWRVATGCGLRCTLNMPALVTVRHDTGLAWVCRSLIGTEKSAIVAITAVMLNPLLTNALICNDRKWAEIAP